jgi:hypothetical protein
MSTLDTSPVSKRQEEKLTFQLLYPKMIGKTPENFDDFYRGIPGEQKNIWLHINTEPACFDEENVEVVSDDLHEIANYFQDPDTRKRESIIRNKDCPTKWRFDIKYSVFGYNNSWYPHGWKKSSLYADLSEYYKMENLNLDGYRMSCLSGDGECVLDERVYRYIPPNAKADEYEFIVCGSNPDIMPKKFPKIRFDNDLHASCTHYMLIKNRMIAQVRYSEKYFKQHWQGIRDAVLKNFYSRITAVDDYVPQFYTKHNNAYKAVSQQQIDDYIQKIQKQTAN